MTPVPIRTIVESGLCIGCGLCVPIAGADNVEMRMTQTGVERPAERTPVTGAALEEINAVCPGLQVEVEVEAGATFDPVWGPIRRIAKGYAADPEVRHAAASGGVLTALGRFLLESGRVEQVLHVGAVRGDPLSWEAKVSTTAAEVLERAGSRYGPAAALVRLFEAIDAPGRTAVIAKPCDVAAVRNVLRRSPDQGESVPYLLALGCGGASKMTKTHELLERFGLHPDDVAELSYRGYGNPGPTRLVTTSGATHDTTYQELWEDQGSWDLQWRCKICADGMGETADLVSLDCWPGGGPTGEDEGFNGIITRTAVGSELLGAAIAAGVVELSEDDLSADVLELWQPHQSRRKNAVPGRLAAMAAAALPTTTYVGLNLERLGNPGADPGTADRIAEARNSDPQPDWKA